MGLFKKDPETQRYYLYPGQGGRAVRRKQVMMLWWSISAGIVISIGLAFLIYWLNNNRH